MIACRERDNYFVFNVKNPAGYPDWIRDLDTRCYTKISECLAIAEKIQAEGLEVKFINFSHINQ
jgi:hypothetical protein